MKNNENKRYLFKILFKYLTIDQSMYNVIEEMLSVGIWNLILNVIKTDNSLKLNNIIVYHKTTVVQCKYRLTLI